VCIYISCIIAFHRQINRFNCDYKILKCSFNLYIGLANILDPHFGRIQHRTGFYFLMLKDFRFSYYYVVCIIVCAEKNQIRQKLFSKLVSKEQITNLAYLHFRLCAVNPVRFLKHINK